MFNSQLGLKQGYAITNMPPGSCLDIKNMYLNGLGGKVSRNGYVEIFHNTNGVSGARITDRVRSLIQYNPFSGTSEVLDYAGTRIFRQNGTATDIVRSGLVSDTPWEWLQYRDFILGVNGTSDASFLYSNNSTTTTSWGASYVKISLTPPASHLTPTVGAGGALPAGTYAYLMTFYDSATGRESNPFTVATAPTAISAGSPGNATITLSAFPAVTAGEGIDKRRIYRKLSTETLFSRIAEIAVATTTYADAGDAATTLYLDYDTGAYDVGNTPLPRNAAGESSSLICEAFDRIFMVDPTDPSILVFSKVGDYWSYPIGNYLYIGRGDGSTIKRIEKHGKSLLIHKGNGWYILESDPVGSYQTDGTVITAPGVPKFISKIGTQDFRTSVSAHNQVVRLSQTGFYRSVPTEFDTADLREDYIGNDIANFETNLDFSNSSIATMYNYNAANRRHVYYIEPISASFYSKCYVFDIVLSQWVYYEIGTDVFSVGKYVTLNKEYMMMGDGYGIVWQWDVGDSDGHSLTSAEANGTCTASSGTTLTDSTKTWTVNSLIGCVVSLWDGTGRLQKRRILSNTANQITVATWTTTPDTTTTYSIGGIEKYAEEYWDSNGDPHVKKRARWIVPYVRQTGDYDITISFRKDFQQAYDQIRTLSLLSSSSLWGTMLWLTGLWGASSSNLKRINLHGKYHYYTIKYENHNAGQQFYWDGHGMVFQVMPDRMR